MNLIRHQKSKVDSISFCPASDKSVAIFTPYDATSMLTRLMNIGKQGTGVTTTVTEGEMVDLVIAARQLFMTQPMMVECSSPVHICGDIHGQFGDLIRLFNLAGWPPHVNYVFLGDYIDRGRWSLETILFLFAIKLRYPDNFVLLRGNHETGLVNKIYGFYEDLNRRYGTARLYNTFLDTFNTMPLTCLVEDRILCMHGGLSNDLLNAASLDILNQITRPCPDPPNPSLPLDLLWSDPDIAVKDFKVNIRGVSCTFGPTVVAQTCEKFGLDLIVRAHQVVQDGYEFFANKKLVTVFSAPHYCGQFDNSAAIMLVSKELKCSFKVLRPAFPGRPVPKH